MAHLICYSIIMGPIRFFLPGAHSMLKPALMLTISKETQLLSSRDNMISSIANSQLSNTLNCAIGYDHVKQLIYINVNKCTVMVYNIRNIHSGNTFNI